MKVSIKEWIKIEFAKQSKPKEKTIRENCRKGLIPNSIKIGNRWYIEIEIKENKNEKYK
jgi:hypothetical protein